MVERERVANSNPKASANKRFMLLETGKEYMLTVFKLNKNNIDMTLSLVD